VNSDAPGSYRRSHSSTATTRVDGAAAEQLAEGAPKVVVEDGVQYRIDAGVRIAEPEEERVEGARHRADVARTPAADDVDGEEADPHAAEERDDDRHADRRLNLALFQTPHRAGATALHAVGVERAGHAQEQFAETASASPSGHCDRGRHLRRPRHPGANGRRLVVRD